MFSKPKWLVLALCAAIATSTIFVETADAQRRGGSSFRSSSRSSSSFKSSSKPKYSSSTKSTPKATATPQTGSKSKYSSSNGASSTKPKYGTSTTTKPVAAKSKEYVKTPSATLPPKSKYTTSNGKTVNVRPDSPTVKSIRSRPSTDYTPERRTERYTTVINNHNYSQPYSWYGNQPNYFVGGGYSSAFWWIMMTEWSAERRALWLHNNQNTIEKEAYEKGMKDQAVAAELARLKAEKVAVNPDYVDPDFKDNPDLMYSQDFVEAAYNPKVVEKPSVSWASVLFWVALLVALAIFMWYTVFRMKITPVI